MVPRPQVGGREEDTVTLWDMGMRLRVEADESDLPAIWQELQECGRRYDPRPRFTTAQAALVDAMDANRHQPPPKAPVMAREPEHRRTGRTKRAI